jgi:hypothetical protein
MARSCRTKTVRRQGPRRQSAAVEELAAKRRRQRAWAGGSIVALAASIGLGAGLSGGSAGQATSRTPPETALRLGLLAALGSLKSPGSPGPSGPADVPVPPGPVLAPPMTRASPSTEFNAQVASRSRLTSTSTSPFS